MRVFWRAPRPAIRRAEDAHVLCRKTARPVPGGNTCRGLRLTVSYISRYRTNGEHRLADQLQESLQKSLGDGCRVARGLQVNAEVGRGLYLLRRYDEAIHHLQASMKIDPTFGGFHEKMGAAYMMKGDPHRGDRKPPAGSHSCWSPNSGWPACSRWRMPVERGKPMTCCRVCKTAPEMARGSCFRSCWRWSV